MLTKLEKEKIIKLKNYNDLMCQFFPNEISNTKPTNQTKSNVLLSTGHLTRGTENTIDSLNYPSICFSLNNLLSLFLEKRYGEIFQAFGNLLENLLNHIKNQNQKDIKKRLKELLDENVINFSCFYNGLKISTIIEKHETNYKYQDNLVTNNYFFSTEKIYVKKMNLLSYEESKFISYKLVKLDIKATIQYFVCFLTSLDEQKYKFLIEEYNNLYFKFI